MSYSVEEFKVHMQKQDEVKRQKEADRKKALRPNRHDRKRMVRIEEPQIFRGRASTSSCVISAAELKRQKAMEYSKEDEYLLAHGC